MLYRQKLKRGIKFGGLVVCLIDRHITSTQSNPLVKLWNEKQRKALL
jgi:hypothetical protein